MENENIIELEDISKAVKKQVILDCINFRITKDSMIGIYGQNGSGKSLLSEILAGRIKADSGRIIEKAGGCRVSVVSSSEKLRILEEDRRNDDSEFMGGKTDPGRSVMSFLSGGNDAEVTQLTKEFEMNRILDRGLKFLSTGEFRKVLLVKALIQQPDLLILDDPFTGLDLGMREELKELIGRISSGSGAVLIITGRLGDFKGLTTNIKNLEGGKLKDDSVAKPANKPVAVESYKGNVYQSETAGRELIGMSGVSLSFYELKVLNDINWKVVTGDHWQIRGRNGSGKSSLLSLINGDSPKAYGQKIDLFGRRRGTGETIWDIKKRIGTVSGALQLNHRISQNVLSVAVSGYFDTIGLYDRPDPVQIETAEEWCVQFGLKDELNSPFEKLSEGYKRKVLTVRAVIKNPDLLILDEPCQGLDDYNSAVVLDTVELLIERNHSTLLYVSHDPEYKMTSITNIMDLIPHSDGGFTSIT
jgi:molybdate transport system ATP-binding protein